MHSIDMPARGTGHEAPITHVAFNCDATRLATSSYDGSVIVWDVADPRSPLPCTTLQHRRLVNSSTWSPVEPHVLASASADKTVVVWEVGEEVGHVRTVLARHTDDVNSVAWSPDGTQIVCVSEDGRASRWDAQDGRYLGEIAAHEAHCMMVAISSGGDIATVGEDGLVSILDQDGSRHEHRYEGSVEGCAWSPDGARLAVARDSGEVDVLSAAGDVLHTSRVAASAARSVAWSSDGALLFAGAYDGGVHVLDSTGRVQSSHHHGRYWPRSLAVAGDLLAVGSWTSAPLLLTPDLELQHDGGRDTYGVNAMAHSQGRLLLGTDAGSLVEVGIGDADSAPSMQPEARTGRCDRSPVLSVAAHGDQVLLGRYSGAVTASRRDELDACSVTVDLGAPVASLTSLDDAVIAGTYNGELVELDPADLSIRRRSEAHDGSVKSVVPFGDSGLFVSGATDRRVAVGTFEDRTVVWEHGNLVNAVACSGEGVIASAARDHTVKVGQVSAGGEILRGPVSLLAGDESVKAVGVLGTQESPVVLAGSYDFGLYAWHVDWDQTDSVLRTGTLLRAYGQAVSCISVLDDRRAAVASWDGSLTLVTLGADGELSLSDDLSVPALAEARSRVVA